MSMNLEKLTKGSKETEEKFKETKDVASEIADSKTKTIEALSDIKPIDEDIMDCVKATSEEVRSDAKGDYANRVEKLFSETDAAKSKLVTELQESANDTSSAKRQLDSLAGNSEYGKSAIKDASASAEHRSKEYSDVGVELEDAGRETKRDLENKKREIDS